MKQPQGQQQGWSGAALRLQPELGLLWMAEPEKRGFAGPLDPSCEFQPSDTGGLCCCFDLNVALPGHSLLEQESIEPVLCFLQEPIIMRS